MPSTIKPANTELIVPYGSQSVRSQLLEQLQAGQTDDLERPGAPVVVIDRAQQLPLRMHDLVHPFTLPPIAQDLAHAQTQLAFLEQHLSRHCGEWAKSSQAFVERYFADLRAVVGANEEAILKKAGALSGLVEAEHWCFSALMPLPRAHLYLPETSCTGDYRAADFVMVDFAFWSGSGLVAVLIDNGNTPTGARKKALDRLAANDITLQKIGTKALRSDQSRALLTALGPAFETFWSDTPLARSPFRGRGVEAPVRAERLVAHPI
jgi:hypothetical protein